MTCFALHIEPFQFKKEGNFDQKYVVYMHINYIFKKFLSNKNENHARIGIFKNEEASKLHHVALNIWF